MLEVEGLTVSYGDSGAVFSEISLQCPVGQLICVLGTNGAGKTTLLRAITGTLGLYGGKIRSGAIRMNGDETTRLAADKLVRKGLITSPEGRGIFAGLTTEENLRVGAFTQPRSRLPELMERSFELFPELQDLRERRAGLLSGGEQQMLAIARALVSDPKVLLLDEPSLGLAPKIVDRVAQRVHEIHEAGTSVILVEQNAVMALDLADYAYVLESGRIAMHGPASELRDSDSVRRLYLGLEVGTQATQGGPHGGE